PTPQPCPYPTLFRSQEIERQIQGVLADRPQPTRRLPEDRVPRLGAGSGRIPGRAGWRHLVHHHRQRSASRAQDRRSPRQLAVHVRLLQPIGRRSEEHTSELQSREISYAVFCLKKKTSVNITANEHPKQRVQYTCTF